MQLARAFAIRDKEVVSFVGGGGKTTTMFRLAAELVAQGKRVVTTTTTRIFAAQIKLAPQHIFATTLPETLHAAREALRRGPHVLVIGATNQEGKAFGVEPVLVNELIALDQVDAVLCEADGSRMRPFKAPGEHEPVVPPLTTLLVPVVGIDAVGAPLDDAHVHRAAIVARLAGIPPGTVLEPQHIAHVLAHPEGGLKGKPVEARVIALINKVENDAQLAQARQVAHHLLECEWIDAVAIGAVRDLTWPITRLEQRVAAIILAAGGSTRMGGQVKQLLPWGNSTLVRHTVEVVQRAQLAQIIVVTGNRAEQVAGALDGTDVEIVFNPDWPSGRASSVRAGLRAVSPKSAAALFINADQPFLTVELIDRIVSKFASSLAPIVVPLYKGKRGSPVLFARKYFDELEKLEGDVGGKVILEREYAAVESVNIADSRAAVDVDTPEDYQTALGLREKADHEINNR